MIIGIGHRKQQGKDTLAKMIEYQWVIGAGIVSFATPIYECCWQLYKHVGFQKKEYYDRNPHEKMALLENGKTVRQVLIDVGELMRSYDPDVFVQAALAVHSAYRHIIIPDLRHHNEFKGIKDQGGICVKVVRPGDKEAHGTFNTDIDEILKDETDWDFIIHNDGTKAQLNTAATIIAGSIVLGYKPEETEIFCSTLEAS
jgi:hypothetical protein